MKKINLFNRNTNLPSYRRRGLPFPWERGPAEQPGGMGITPSPLSPTKFLKFCGTRFGATPSWKEGERSGRGGLWFAALVALFIATPSFADPTPAEVAAQNLAKKTVASQYYVDQELETKQDKIPAAEEGYQSVLIDTDTDGEVEKMQIVTSAYMENEGMVLDDVADLGVPTAGAVYYELNNYWQPKIETDLIEFDGEQLRPIVTTNASGIGVNGTDIAIIDSNVASSSFGGLQFATDASDIDLDVFIPTVGAVAEALRAFSWHPATSPAAINAYSVTFDGTTGNWPSRGEDYLVPAYTFVNSLALKQNKLPAKSTGDMAPKGNQAVVLNTAGNPLDVYTTAGKDLALTAKSGAQRVMNYIDGTTASATFATSQGLTEAQVKSALVSLELLKDVYAELNSKITNNALPTGTTGTVVTYNGVNAETGVQEFGERAVYDPANAYNAQTDATKLATMASVKYECAGYEAGHENDPDYCWLWTLPN